MFLWKDQKYLQNKLDLEKPIPDEAVHNSCSWKNTFLNTMQNP